ncbi:MAG: hypothetical protein MJA84_02270 [Firmicutes bacterium]|nr:hypothetical protein [Bacillota bacterium]
MFEENAINQLFLHNPSLARHFMANREEIVALAQKMRVKGEDIRGVIELHKLVEEIDDISVMPAGAVR